MHSRHIQSNVVAYLEVSELSESAIASIKAANLLSIVTHRGEKQKQQKSKNAASKQKHKKKTRSNPKKKPKPKPKSQ